MNMYELYYNTRHNDLFINVNISFHPFHYSTYIYQTSRGNEDTLIGNFVTESRQELLDYITSIYPEYVFGECQVRNYGSTRITEDIDTTILVQ